MIGAIIAGAGALAGGIMSAVNANKQRKALKAMRRRNDAWYERNYNEDATQRADAVAMMTKLEEDIKDRNRGAAGRSAVMGVTDEGARAEREANSKATGEAAANIVAASAGRKEAVEREHKQRDESLDQAEANVSAQQTANMAAATQGVTAAGAAMAGGKMGNDTGKETAEAEQLEAPIGDVPDAPAEAPVYTEQGTAQTNYYAQSERSLFDIAEDAQRNDAWMV